MRTSRRLNPAERDGPELSLPLEPLGIEVGRLAGAIGREEAEEDARSALNRAAKKLNRSPPEAWGDDPPIVFAVDLEHEHLAQNLRQAVPAAGRRQLGLKTQPEGRRCPGDPPCGRGYR